MSTKKSVLFLDTEFTGLHQYTTLVSIGIVAENGASFYAELTDYDQSQIDDWLSQNVIANLELQEISTPYFKIKNGIAWEVKGDQQWVKGKLIEFLDQFEEVVFWLDHLAYDWVLFCQLFGHALQIPEQVYYIPFDLSTFFKIKGIDPDIKREDFIKEELMTHQLDLHKHNALYDAQIIQLCYKKLLAWNKKQAP